MICAQSDPGVLLVVSLTVYVNQKPPMACEALLRTQPGDRAEVLASCEPGHCQLSGLGKQLLRRSLCHEAPAVEHQQFITEAMRFIDVVRHQ